MIVVFWAATGFAHLGVLRELKDDMRKRIVILLTYVILGTSSVLLITVYNFVHPLNAHRIYLSSHSPIFFFEGGPLMLFLFTWGCSVSLLALGFIGLTAREKRLEDHFLCGKYLGEFGMVLCVVGMLLPISTAVFSYFFRFLESVPSGPAGIWVFPYLPHGIVLFCVGALFLATSVILSRRLAFSSNQLGIWRLVGGSVLLFVWLLSPEWLAYLFGFAAMFFSISTASHFIIFPLQSEKVWRT
ncbi:hypothetical protein KAU88_06055 [Candidatus Bathyarchaeota archaeon]|nr:hypothetical protein [Candidatus Bathyarchaeota archaeon]